MATNIVLKRSATEDAVPGTSDLALGELALNTYDGKLYMKKTVGGSSSIVQLGPIANAATVTVADESSDTTCFPLFTTAATGDLAAKSGSNLAFNSSSGVLTATGFAGALTGNVTGNASGTALTVTQAAQTTITSVGTLTSLAVSGNATVGGTLGVTGNTTLSANLTLAGYLGMPDNAEIQLGTGDDFAIYHDGSNSYIKDAGTGALRILGSQIIFRNVADDETIIHCTEDGAVILYYDNAAKLATVSGGINITGDTDTDTLTVSGNATVGGTLGVTGALTGTLGTAAQTNITSLGTLTALTVDDINLNGKVITMTGSTSDTAVLTAGTNGTLDITTTDDNAAAANIQITADGTAELAGTTVTLDSGGGITIDADSGTITFADGGASLGTITSAGYTGNVVGNVTGNASGTAATVTTAAQTAITSVGTLTALTVTGTFTTGGGTSITNAGVLTLEAGGSLTTAASNDLNIVYPDGRSLFIKEASTTSVTIDNAQKVTLAGALDVTGVTTLSTHLVMGDSDIIKLGAGTDLQLWSDGSTVLFQGDDIRFRKANGNYIAQFVSSSAKLFYDNAQKLATVTGGINITGDTDTDTLTVSGNATVGGTLGVTGVVTANAGVVIDTITIDAGEIDQSSGNLTLDVAGDIILDAGGSEIFLKRQGTEWGQLFSTGTNFYLYSSVSNGDMIFMGNDGGSAFTALTLDMSEAGAATFNSTVTSAGFTSTAASTITTADNLDTLTLTSTDADASVGPNLRLYRNSGSPADNDSLGWIEFEGINDNSQLVKYADIKTYIEDASDGSEDGAMYINTMVAGTLRNTISLLPTGVVFNDESQDVDFRVESDGNANMLVVDAGNNYVLMGNSVVNPVSGYNDQAGFGMTTTGLFQMATTANDAVLSLGKNEGTDGDLLVFRKQATVIGSIQVASSDFVIKSAVSDEDIIFKGNDGGSTITALTLDMSDSGTASFLHDIKLPDYGQVIFGGDGDFLISFNGTSTGSKITANNGPLTITTGTSDKDMVFVGNDGGSTITALTLDMSDAGAATFNSTVQATGFNIGGTAITSTAAELNVLDPALKESNSIWIGSDPTSSTDTAEYNTAVGHEVLDAITTGDRNAALGYSALGVLTTGHRNAAVGAVAGQSLTTGAHNTFMGNNAGGSTTTADNNTAIGSGALATNSTGANSVAVGYGALTANTTAGGNTAVGYQALDANTTGGGNNAIGNTALGANTTGANNVALGSSTLANNTTGQYNTGLGNSALYVNTTGASNVAVGYEALDANTTASNNTAVGFSALGANTTGANNTAVGYQAGDAVTGGGGNVLIGTNAGGAQNTAAYNTAIGYGALATSTTGPEHVAIGGFALNLMETGEACVAVGQEALRNNLGSSNTAVGYQSMDACTDGTQLTAVGRASLGAVTTGSGHVAVGMSALQTMTTGTNGTAVGFNALKLATGNDNTAMGYHAATATSTGASNTALGAYSLDANTTGAGNVAIGYGSLGTQTGADNNVAVGVNALWANTSGTNNVAVGQGALDANTTADNNTAVGDNALGTTTTGHSNSAFGANALLDVSDASGNTGLGYWAGKSVSTGGSNTLIGYQAGQDTTALTTGSNCTIIGLNAHPNASDGEHQIVLGVGIAGWDDTFAFGKVSNVVWNNFGTNATWTRSSDERKKTNIADATLGLDFIDDLRTVTYKWKRSQDIPNTLNDYDANVNHMNTDVTMHGMLAQDVKAALDTAGVTTFGGWAEESDSSQSLSQEMFIYPLIKAVQELSAKVKELEDRLE